MDRHQSRHHPQNPQPDLLSPPEHKRLRRIRLTCKINCVSFYRMDKPICLSEHVKMRLVSRGASEQEIFETIKTCSWQKAELNRQECRKNFPFNAAWNGQHYQTKQIRPIFIEEKDSIIIVTIYVYYF